jgi:hypothetical protein
MAGGPTKPRTCGDGHRTLDFLPPNVTDRLQFCHPMRRAGRGGLDLPNPRGGPDSNAVIDEVFLDGVCTAIGKL